jgi:putative sterol carrier protein
MQIRSLITDMLDRVNIEPGTNMDLAINFIIHGADATDEFQVRAKGSQIEMHGELAESPMAVIDASEKTLQSILDLGIDPVELLMKLTIPSEAEKFKIPEIESSLYVETGTTNGYPILFKIHTAGEKLYITEGESFDNDIEIKIKPSFLPKLIEGDVNLAMALLTGKIKISNKRDLFQLLTKLGLTF